MYQIFTKSGNFDFQLDTWGSVIRLYGHGTQQKQQEARKSRQSIIKLQGVHTLLNGCNFSLI